MYFSFKYKTTTTHANEVPARKNPSFGVLNRLVFRLNIQYKIDKCSPYTVHKLHKPSYSIKRKSVHEKSSKLPQEHLFSRNCKRNNKLPKSDELYLYSFANNTGI